MVRPLEEGDLADVQALLGSLAETLGDPAGPAAFSGEQLAAMRARPDLYRNFVAVLDGRPIGVLSMVMYKTLLHRGGTALVNELVVARQLRGRGVGAALLSRAVSEALGAGMDEVEVGTGLDNRRAIAFYRREGFDRRYLLLGRELDRPGPHSTASSSE